MIKVHFLPHLESFMWERKFEKIFFKKSPKHPLMGCCSFSNFHFQMGVSVMRFAEHFGHCLVRVRRTTGYSFRKVTSTCKYSVMIKKNKGTWSSINYFVLGVWLRKLTFHIKFFFLLWYIKTLIHSISSPTLKPCKQVLWFQRSLDISIEVQ